MNYGLRASDLLHEMVHAADFCVGWVGTDCGTMTCTELKAYYAALVKSHPIYKEYINDPVR